MRNTRELKDLNASIGIKGIIKEESVMEIELDRLLLRPYNDNDLDFLESLLTNPDMMKYIGNGQTRNQNGIKDFLEWIYDTYSQNPNYGLMLILERGTNKPIGHAGLVPQLSLIHI